MLGSLVTHTSIWNGCFHNPHKHTLEQCQLRSELRSLAQAEITYSDLQIRLIIDIWPTDTVESIWHVIVLEDSVKYTRLVFNSIKERWMWNNRLCTEADSACEWRIYVSSQSVSLHEALAYCTRLVVRVSESAGSHVASPSVWSDPAAFKNPSSCNWFNKKKKNNFLISCTSNLQCNLKATLIL